MSDGFISAFSAGPKVLLETHGHKPHLGGAGPSAGGCGQAAATTRRPAGK